MNSHVLNTMRPRQNGRYFADDTFTRIFLNENVIISIKISLKSVPKGPIRNIPALVQIMAWRRPGDKPFSEAMMVCLLTHICVIRPQWVKISINFTINISHGFMIAVELLLNTQNCGLQMHRECRCPNTIVSKSTLVHVMKWRCSSLTYMYMSPGVNKLACKSAKHITCPIQALWCNVANSNALSYGNIFSRIYLVFTIWS